MKIKLKAFLHWHKYSWSDEIDFELCPCDMTSTSKDYALISEHEFEVEIPDDFDPRPQQVASLKAEKQKVMADCQVKIDAIDDQISRLTCIENKVTV